MCSVNQGSTCPVGSRPVHVSGLPPKSGFYVSRRITTHKCIKLHYHSISSSICGAVIYAYQICAGNSITANHNTEEASTPFGVESDQNTHRYGCLKLASQSSVSINLSES